MTKRTANMYKPLKRSKKASSASPTMKCVSGVNICELQAEVKRLRKENENIKKGLPLWRKASAFDNAGDNTWCILYSKIYGIGTGYWSPCYGWMFHQEAITHSASSPFELRWPFMWHTYSYSGCIGNPKLFPYSLYLKVYLNVKYFHTPCGRFLRYCHPHGHCQILC